MKQTIRYVVYLLFAVTITYFVEIFLSFIIVMMLFEAADGPPGDLSESTKLLFSVGMPAVYAFALFGLYFLIKVILENFKIYLNSSVGILFHILIALYLIWNIVPCVF